VSASLLGTVALSVFTTDHVTVEPFLVFALPENASVVDAKPALTSISLSVTRMKGEQEAPKMRTAHNIKIRAIAFMGSKGLG
jgi:hypothetical protein